MWPQYVTLSRAGAADSEGDTMRAGILIIGSLLWDNCQRQAWRRSRLRVDRGVHVSAPICYGRRAASRGNTFTMTFVTDVAQGQAVLVPCIASIAGVGGLVSEAQALWKAELSTAAPESICASWGSVGVLFAPTVGAELRAGWEAYFRSHASPVAPVDEAGLLRIAWPVTRQGKPADVEVVLATATKAEVTRPTVTAVADAWTDQNAGHERYFFENVRHGIRTPEDHLIWQRIEHKNPSWLREGTYAEAVALLRKG